jgi:hypothetical protein
LNIPYTMCADVCNTDCKSNETSIMLSSRYVYRSHSSLRMRSHVCWGSDGEKGMHASVRVLVLGACVCECVTQIPTLYPQSDRDRTNDDNADCCGCTCEWWTDGRQTIFRQTERENITVLKLLNLSCKGQKQSQKNKSIWWHKTLLVRIFVIYHIRTEQVGVFGKCSLLISVGTPVYHDFRFSVVFLGPITKVPEW